MKNEILATEDNMGAGTEIKRDYDFLKQTMKNKLIKLQTREQGSQIKTFLVQQKIKVASE